jgi:superfamily II DNA helicase RecQ
MLLIFLISSFFSRYEVRPKKKSLVDDIDKFVRENHPYECGIIYCLSRTDCEKIAGKLTVRPSLRTSSQSSKTLVAAWF